MEQHFTNLADAVAAANVGDFIITMREGDKFIHAESFVFMVSQIIMGEFAGSDAITEAFGQMFCQMLNEFVEAFPPAPVKLIEQGKTGE